jgi:AmiR/NasT family two-component response regulator
VSEPAADGGAVHEDALVRQLSVAPDDVEVLREHVARLANRVNQLQTALDSRIVIEQAKGLLAERLGLGIDDAFELLRRTARSRRVRLHNLATDLIATREWPPRPTA